jgi:hypothetical protein
MLCLNRASCSHKTRAFASMLISGARLRTNLWTALTTFCGVEAQRSRVNKLDNFTTLSIALSIRLLFSRSQSVLGTILFGSLLLTFNRTPRSRLHYYCAICWVLHVPAPADPSDFCLVIGVRPWFLHLAAAPNFSPYDQRSPGYHRLSHATFFNLPRLPQI